MAADSGLGVKFQRFLQQINYLPFALHLVWTAARGWSALWVGLLALQGVLPVFSVYLTRALVNGLVNATTATVTMATFRPVMIPVLLMALILLAGEMLRVASTYVRQVQAELVQDHISGLIHRQSMAVDLEFYDSPAYFDQLHRARFEATTRPLALLENLGTLFQNSLTMVAMTLVLLPYGWWLPLALLVSSLPAFYVVLHERLRLHRWRLRSTALERRAWYYFHLLTARETAAELRVFQLGHYFQEQYRTVRSKLRVERLGLARRQSLAELGAGISALLVTGLTMFWMVWRTAQGLFTLGDLALFYQAFNQGQQLIRTLLTSVGEIYANSLFLGDLQTFLQLVPTVADGDPAQSVPLPLARGIRFENVTFRYPDSRRVALQNFDLFVPAGRVVAIVGVNGAGKSTFIKLMCRLYDPESGRITVDGVDLRSLRLTELRAQMTVLFQEPVHYQTTAADNITLGDLTRRGDQAAIEAAASNGGADQAIRRLFQGYATPLGKLFAGGADLSVGEWQRVALARAYLRQAPIILLDEPTSAMDPWAETDWLQRFRQLAEGRTAIIITHRFTTAMYADTIHVMDNGRIVESGSHDELLAQGGKYAESWFNQMQQRAHGRPPEVVPAA